MSAATDYENGRRWKALFFRVLEAYVDTRILSPLVATQPDDELPPNRKMGADCIHFLVDVEHAVQKATAEKPDLYEQWLRLVDGQELTAQETERLAKRAGRLFEIRGLRPSLYFKHIRKGRKDRCFVPSGTA